jgi:hypothetical protein
MRFIRTERTRRPGLLDRPGAGLAPAARRQRPAPASRPQGSPGPRTGSRANLRWEERGDESIQPHPRAAAWPASSTPWHETSRSARWGAGGSLPRRGAGRQLPCQLSWQSRASPSPRSFSMLRDPHADSEGPAPPVPDRSTILGSTEYHYPLPNPPPSQAPWRARRSRVSGCASNGGRENLDAREGA